MRKKIFATLMSVAMIASFMPSMAFASVTADEAKDHKWPSIATGTVTNDNVKALKDAEKDSVVEFVPATCTKEGKVTFKCMDENKFCEETKTCKIEKTSHEYADQQVTVDEYCKLMQAAKQSGFANDAQTAAQAKELAKTVCYYNVKVCKNCGIIDTTNVKAVNHEHPNNETADCKAKTNCTFCGKEIAKNATSLPKHSYEGESAGSIKAGVNPTSEKKLCGDVTEKTYTCTVCGATKKVLVNKAGTEVIKAPCKVFKTPVETVVGKDGKTVYKKGSQTVVVDADGSVKPGYMASEIFANTYYAADTTITEGNVVYYGYTCADCGNVVKGAKKGDAEAAHKHEWKKVTVAATCTEPAKETLECTVCGKYANVNQEKVENPTVESAPVYTTVKDAKGNDTKANGHNFVIKEVAATCGERAHYEITCANCTDSDKVAKKDQFAKVVVSFEDVAKDAPKYFHEEGTVTSTSNKITDKELKYLDPTLKNHVFTKKVVLKEATCEVGEISSYKCDNCGKIKAHGVTIKAGSALGHDHPETEVAATCVNKAYKVKAEECTRCGKTDDKIVAANKKAAAEAAIKGGKHSFDKWVVTKEATVFEEGIKELKCSKCDAAEGTKTVVAKKTVGKPVVKLVSKKGKLTVKASAADNATGYEVTYKRAGKKAVTKTYTAESISKTYKLLKGKKYTVKVTAFASNGTDTVKGATVTKTITIKK